MKYPSNTGCLGIFILFVSQIILIIMCLIAGIGNTDYDLFINEFSSSEYSSIMDIFSGAENLNISPFQLSIIAIAILILGLIIFLRYWVLSNKKSSQNAVTNEPNLSAHDRTRKKLSSVMTIIIKIMNIIMLILSIFPAVFVIYTIGFGEPNSSELIFATKVCFIALAIFFVWLAARAAIAVFQAILAGILRANQPTKAQLIISEMKSIFGENNYGYVPNGSFFVDPYETKVVRKYDRMITNDHIYGTYKGLSFEQLDVFLHDSVGQNAQLHTATQTFVTSDSAHKFDNFKGRWIVVHQPKISSSRFYIISKKTYDDELERFKIVPGLSEVFLEDSEFNQRFVIYAESPHDVFYVMTPPLIERLKNFADMGDGEKDFSIRLGFYQNRIHLVICGLVDAFEHLYGAHSLDLSATEESARISVRRDLNLITDFIDSLFDHKEV